MTANRKSLDAGIMRVDLLSGSGLKAADRNGKSDPYVVFYLNGEKLPHKSTVQKKTLNPVWKGEVRASCYAGVVD